MAGTGHAPLRDDPNVLLTVTDLEVEFPVGRNAVVHAVSGISFDVAEGSTLGIVGESARSPPLRGRSSGSMRSSRATSTTRAKTSLA